MEYLPHDISHHYSVFSISVAIVEHGGKKHYYFCKAHKIVPGRRNLRNDGVDCYRAVMVMSKQGKGCEWWGVSGVCVCVCARTCMCACDCGETPVMHFPICLSDCGWLRMCGCASERVGPMHDRAYRSQLIRGEKKKVLVRVDCNLCCPQLSSSHLKRVVMWFNVERNLQNGCMQAQAM